MHSLFWSDTHPLATFIKELHKLIVPSKGAADTIPGELLRTATNFLYDQYNNGHCNFDPKSSDYEALIYLVDKTQLPLSDNSLSFIQYLDKCLRKNDKANDASTYVDRETDCPCCYGRSSSDDESDHYCSECDGSGTVYDDEIMSPKEELEQELRSMLKTFDDENLVLGLDELIVEIYNYSMNEAVVSA